MLSGKEEKTLIKEGFYTQEEIYKNNIVPTLSLVFRNNIVIPGWFKFITIGDWYLHILNTRRGPYYCKGEYMGVYRKITSGVFSGLDQIGKAKVRLEFYKKSKSIINKKLLFIRLIKISECYYQVAKNTNKYSEKVIYFFLSLFYSPFQIKVIVKRFKTLFL